MLQLNYSTILYLMAFYKKEGEKAGGKEGEEKGKTIIIRSSKIHPNMY